MERNKYALVILSHASYSDVWPILINSFDKYFVSNDFDLFISTNRLLDDGDTESSKKSKFQFVYYANDIPWSNSLMETLKKLERYERVIFSFDDLVLSEHVDTVRLLNILDDTSASYLKLICSHVRFYERFFLKSERFEVDKDDSYRGSLVFTMLSQSLMKELVATKKLYGLSPWQYEMNVNKYLSDEFSYFAQRSNIFKFRNLIIKGKVDPISFFFLRVFNNLYYKGNRSFFRVRDFLLYYIKLFSFTLIKYFVPRSIFSKIRSFKKKIG